MTNPVAQKMSRASADRGRPLPPKRESLDPALTFLAGLGLGAGLMYLFDPQMGRRRRTLLEDRVTSGFHEAGDALCMTGRDMVHRAQGLAAEATDFVTREPVSDQTLVARVRSRLGRVVSHPHALAVSARNGLVTLSGPILSHELENLCEAVYSVPGVTGVEDRLEVHARPGKVPSLQGGRARTGARADLFQKSWSPTTRALMGAAGGGLFALGLTQRFPFACLLGTAGLALAAQSATNKDLGRLLGVSGGRRAIDVQKTLTIAGPVERVFPFFARYSTFPRFMRNVCEVQDLGRGRSHWVVAGPAGVPVSWKAVVTQFVPNQVLAWKSEPGSTVPNAGIIRFEPAAHGSTRVSIRFSYNPPGGALGHFAAQLFGADAKSEMDEDLMRLKCLIEEGKTHAPGKEQVARQDVAGRTAVSSGSATPR